MSRTLSVFMHEEHIGDLIQDDHGQMNFQYAAEWLNATNAVPLSLSLPLRTERYDRKECKGFFEGILPEQSNRIVAAKNLGISAKNDFAMLEKIGGECAGAVTFLSDNQVSTSTESTYKTVTNSELAIILQELPARPLLAGEDGIRLSLAGAQDKIAVYTDGTTISLPLENAPSSHILKPDIQRFKGLVFNEAYCMRLAKAIGLPTAEVKLRNTEGIDYLLVERYDRKTNLNQDNKHLLNRVHQEDFCQALGISSEMKYENEGGPSLIQCFDLVRESSKAPVIDLQRLLDAVVFNYLIGNNDAHGKNFSFLHQNYQHETPASFLGNKSEIRLAPLYDLVCTAIYSKLSQKMAMKIGSKYKSADVYPRHFDSLADGAGLAKPLVRKRILDIANTVLDNVFKIEIPNDETQKVASFIKERCGQVEEIHRLGLAR